MHPFTFRVALASAPILATVACGNGTIDIKPDATGAGGSNATSASSSTSNSTSHGTQGSTTAAGAGGMGGMSSSAVATTGAGGASCCSQPLQIAGSVKTLTADTDLNQLVTATAPGGQKIVDGPFIMTDAAPGGYPINMVPNGDCTQPGIGVAYGQQNFEIHGAHIFVPTGSSLCGGAPSGYIFVVSGFRPY